MRDDFYRTCRGIRRLNGFLLFLPLCSKAAAPRPPHSKIYVRVYCSPSAGPRHRVRPFGGGGRALKFMLRRIGAQTTRGLLSGQVFGLELLPLPIFCRRGFRRRAAHRLSAARSCPFSGKNNSRRLAWRLPWRRRGERPVFRSTKWRSLCQSRNLRRACEGAIATTCEGVVRSDRIST